MLLKDRVALVTGSANGMGRGIAHRFAEEGCDLIINDLSLDAAQKVADEIKSRGRRAIAVKADITNSAEIEKMTEAAIKEFGRIDILVNNAGTILRKPISEHPDEYWDKVIEINLTAQFILTRELGKKMVERGYGKIVFIASLLSFQGGILVPGYAASKGGIKQLTMSFANEWASKGVTVNAIAPGYIATDNTKALREDPLRNKSILDRIPAGRWGTPEDLMSTVVFLSSDASNYLNGTVITVDGGWMGR